MFTRFGQIFWGMMLVILDFSIKLNTNSSIIRIDILPDIIGYVLVAVGCAGLSGVSRHFSTASILSWILATFTLIPYALQGSTAHGFGFLNIMVECTMTWFLLGGVMELTAAQERMDLSRKAANRRIAYVALMCIAALARFVVQGSQNATATMVVVVLSICNLTLWFLILHLIHRVKHELTNDRAA